MEPSFSIWRTVQIKGNGYTFRAGNIVKLVDYLAKGDNFCDLMFPFAPFEMRSILKGKSLLPKGGEQILSS